jgi:hypothetical protein
MYDAPAAKREEEHARAAGEDTMSQYPPHPAPAGSSGPKLFISYRRADSASVAGRMYDRLAAYFGREVIFKDVDNIPIGANFEQVIAGVIAQSAVTLVLIGPRWATIANERGRRLDDPRDVTRLEIEAALRGGKPVIPVLVEGAAPPNVAELPPSVRPLFAHGTVPVRNDPWFDGDMSQLATILSQWLPMRMAAPSMLDKPASVPNEKPTTRRRGGWLATPLGLTAGSVLIVAVALLGLGGLGLVGLGPFGALGRNATPYATAPTQPTATATPPEHVTLSENLTAAQRGWEVDSGCAFKSDGYHVGAPSGYIGYCEAPGTYTNFHLTARVHAPARVTRVEYALVFRASDTNDLDYFDMSLMLVPNLPPTPATGPETPTPTPNLATLSNWDVTSNISGSGQPLGGSSTFAATVTGHGDNLLEVYASGPDITVLVNGTPLGSFRDTANDRAGKIGLGVISGEAIYTSVRIATLG